MLNKNLSINALACKGVKTIFVVLKNSFFGTMYSMITIIFFVLGTFFEII